jgi:predicted TIM-barrel fold metal-dependent hydrolase
VTAVDTHAHVFRRDLPMAADRRYTPDYDASPEDYLALLDRHGIERGVLVQPSFLGTDNSYLLDCLAQHPDRLGGVVVLDPTAVDTTVLDQLYASGVRGVRLNLIGGEVPEMSAWAHLSDHMAALGVHIELQARGGQWTRLRPALLDWPGPIVIDHCGLPEGPGDPGRHAVRDLAARDNVWIKVSAPYRSPDDQASRFAAELVETVGPDRLLWGSDWPWTQHEEDRTYGDLLSWARAILGSHFRRVLRENPPRLFGN